MNGPGNARAPSGATFLVIVVAAVLATYAVLSSGWYGTLRERYFDALLARASLADGAADGVVHAVALERNDRWTRAMCRKSGASRDLHVSGAFCRFAASPLRRSALLRLGADVGVGHRP